MRDARPPLGVQILSISCSFRENLACSRPPWRVHAPPSGKSWIRHWWRINSMHFYRLKHSCGKIMFSQASVILSTWGRGCLADSTPGKQPAGLTPSPGQTPSQTATATDGTNPTGMHSCILENLAKSYVGPPQGWLPILRGILDPPLLKQEIINVSHEI